jgi:hypothetical protein
MPKNGAQLRSDGVGGSVGASCARFGQAETPHALPQEVRKLRTLLGQSPTAFAGHIFVFFKLLTLPSERPISIYQNNLGI